jgi:hypothetical protein
VKLRLGYVKLRIFLGRTALTSVYFTPHKTEPSEMGRAKLEVHDGLDKGWTPLKKMETKSLF